MPHSGTPDDVQHPAAQIPLSADLMDRLGPRAEEYAQALWSTAQHRDLGPDDMTRSIRDVNDHFGVQQPGTVIDKWQEIFRNSGGFVTIICEDRVLAGALSPADATELPHAPNGPWDSADTSG